jgi:hypothetical protein
LRAAHGEEEILFFRRAREHRAFREAQRSGYELLLQLRATQPWPDFPEPSAPAPAAEEAAAPGFLPPDLRLPSRQEVAGLMMRWQQPLVVDGEVRTCPGCGAYRDWIVFCMRDDSVWLRCRAGHETKESGLDAAWYNRHAGPVDRFHLTLEEGLRHLGH